MKSKFLILFFMLLMILNASLTLTAQETISYGDTVEGSIEAGERALYTFEASEGDLILAALESADFDTYLYLRDSDDEIIADDDDGGTDLNSLINGFAIPEDGTYTLEAASFDDTSSGDFTLSLDVQEVQQIEYGQTINETELQSGIYSFEGTAGELILANINAESGIETTIELQDPNGFFVTSGNYIDGQMSRLGPIILKETGTYLIKTNATDAYEVSLTSPEPNAIVVGESISATFSEDVQTVYFILENNDNLILDFVVDSGNELDTQMELLSPFGYSVMTSEDSEGSVDPVMAGTLIDEIGTYYLVVSAQNPNATLEGDITLTANTSELERLDSGPKTLQFNFTDTDQYVTFDGTEGEVVRIRATIEAAESFSVPTISLYQGELEVNYVSFNGLKTLEFETTLIEDGEVTVYVQAYSEVTMILELIRDES